MLLVIDASMEKIYIDFFAACKFKSMVVELTFANYSL